MSNTVGGQTGGDDATILTPEEREAIDFIKKGPRRDFEPTNPSKIEA